jgi:hypothetical protein
VSLSSLKLGVVAEFKDKTHRAYDTWRKTFRYSMLLIGILAIATIANK